MDTTAVSSTDLIKRSHINKWEDYQLLKHLIRQAYLSKDGYYETAVTGRRLSMFKNSYVNAGIMSFHTHYSEQECRYMVACYIE